MLMKWYIPREHGAWSMWMTPFIMGALVSPWTILQLPAFMGILFFYLASGSLFAIIRPNRKKESPLPSLIVFLALGLAFMVYPLWNHPEIALYGVIVFALLLINIHFARKRKERVMTNNLVAVVALTSTVLASAHLGYGAFRLDGVVLWVLSSAFFMGSVFFVRSLIRENRNPAFKTRANRYHGLIVLAPLSLGQWWASIALLPSAIKVWLTPFHIKLRTKVIGVVEIVSSVVFLVLTVLLYRSPFV
ncbi:MAG: YwiC-like family protein [Candidatus Desulforudis sp.]|nr:YwiC-like family protein [Desulforudis sp.]